MQQVGLFAAAFIQSVAQSAPYLVIGYLLVAFIREFVPMATMVRWFAPGGMRPVALATGLGVALPMCSCTVLPVGIGLARRGVGRGTILSFLISGPALSPVAIALTITLLGPSLGLLYTGTCLVGAFTVGLIANRLLRRSPMPTTPECALDAPTPVAGPRTLRARLRSSLRWALDDLAPELSVDLIIGLAIAAAVLALLPMGWIGQWLGQQQFLTLIYVIILGIPVYTCTVPSIPVVQSLLLAGMSPGAGIAFLIAGPATNLGELIVLRRQFGGRATTIFVVGLVAMAVGGGLIADHLLYRGYAYQPPVTAGALAPGCCVVSIMPTQARPAGPAEAIAAVPLWHWPFIAVLTFCVVHGLQRRIRRRFAARGVPGVPDKSAVDQVAPPIEVGAHA